jgi:hypothetical protein
MRTRPKIFFLSLFLHAVSFCMGEKVLFIGNSYTAQCSKTISDLFKSESPEWSLSFHTNGGKDLAFHLADSQVTKKVNSQKWDHIVLQEQSQKSGLGENFSKSFQDSVTTFSKIIRKAGAIPYLYLTWGRKDGDSRNSKTYPTYEVMQKKISSAYLLAGEKNKARILPVGFSYAEIKKKNKELFGKLYRNDGSHPAAHGAYLVSCVFWGGLTGKDPRTIQFNGTLSKEDAKILRSASQVALQNLNKN